MEAIRFQADTVVVSPERILQPGQLVVRSGRLAEVTPSTAQAADVDLGQVVLLPGLINCHTHLEFSDLTQPIAAGDLFPDWIGAVVRHRRRLAVEQGPAEQQRSRAAVVAQGARECFRTGTCLIADIVTPPWCEASVPPREEFSSGSEHQPYGLRRADWQQHLGPVAFPRMIALPEIIGLDAARFEDSLLWARTLLEQTVDPDRAVLRAYGISPHAPYSVWAEGCSQPPSGDWPATELVAMHIAESREERQWASSGTGAFQRAFEQLGLPVSPARLQISDAIELLRYSQRGLLIHGNYLTDQELEAIAAAGNITIVYCPRTHEHFKHEPYPLARLLELGIEVVLGTDSRASNPDLDLWQELKAARRKHPQLTAGDAMALITTRAAAALGCDDDLGSLEVGKLAYINVLRTPRLLDRSAVLEQITSPSAPNMSLAPLASRC